MHVSIQKIAYLLLVFSLVTTQVLGDDVNHPKRVLIIYGGVDMGPWEHQFNSGLEKISQQDDAIKLSAEYLSLDQQAGPRLAAYADSLSVLYEGLKIDLILAVLPAASDFVLQFGDRFSKGAPQLHVLPDPKNISKILVAENTAILRSGWASATRNTLALMKQAMPKLQEIYVVSGDSKNDLSYLRRAQRVIEQDKADIAIHYIIGESPELLIENFKLPPANTAIFLLIYDQSRGKKNYRTKDIAEILSKEVELPIFAAFDSLLGTGVIGGNMTQAEQYGLKAADIALARLRNKTVKIESRPKNVNIFDVNALEKWQIPKRNLPADSQFRNDKIPLWQEYRKELITFLIVMAIQLAFILLLIRALYLRKQAEHERDREISERNTQTQMFELVMNHIDDAALIMNPDGTIISANYRGVENTFGYQQSEILGTNIMRLVVREEFLRFPALSALVSMTPTIYHYIDFATNVFQGETISAEILDTQGKLFGYFAIIRDITERLDSEKALHQKNKMEALGNLAGSIAHDFNNILTSIVGNAEIALISIADKKELESSLNSILKASGRAGELVDQILTFSRRDQVQNHPVLDLNALLEECQQLLKPSMRPHTEFAVNFEASLWQIEANGTQLHQVIMNLCANAQYAMSGGGRLKLSAKNQHLKQDLRLETSMVPAGKYVVISITDTGTGIEAKLIDRIYEPFFTTKPVGEGTGMGLAIVYAIIRSHNAFMDLLSVENQGTAISIFFPATIPKIPTKIDPIPTTAQTDKNERIIMIDADIAVLENGKKNLSTLGYQLETYLSAKETIHAYRARTKPCDVIISDQAIPNSLWIDIKAKSTRPPAFIFCSVHQGVQQEADAFLEKPYSINEVSRLVDEVLLNRNAKTL